MTLLDPDAGRGDALVTFVSPDTFDALGYFDWGSIGRVVFSKQPRFPP